MNDTRALLRIGFLATQFDEHYQNLVFHGACLEAENHPIQLIFYEGSNTDTLALQGALDDSAFNLAERTALDGLIIMTNTMGSAFSRNRIERYVASFSHIPIVSIGGEFANTHPIIADTTGGITQITAHLCEVHGRSQFLFLAGPEGHPESESRKAEFISTLESLGCTKKPKIVYADFLEEQAYTRTLKLLDRAWRWDAVVAANDQMALGAIRALEERGISVPGQVSVTGFDDIPYSALSVPPLTTIHQPTKELGRTAIRNLLNIMGVEDGTPSHQVYDMSSAFIIRESCGCTRDTDDEVSNPDAESMKQNIRILFSAQVGERSRSSLIRRIEAAMVRSFSLEDILYELGEGILKLNIAFAAIALFDANSASMDWANLLMLHHHGETRVLAPYGMRFPTNDLIPFGLPEDLKAFVCEPLQFGSEKIGYFICTPDAENLHIYASLRDILTTSIKGAQVMALEKDREMELERQVQRRTIELSSMNEQLKQEVRQRRQLEQELLEISNNIMTSIGQDIHDDLCQDLAGLGMLAATLNASLRSHSEPKVRQLARQISDSALESAYRAKQIARDLYPSDFEENGIVNAVKHLVNSRSNPNQITITLDVDEHFHFESKQRSFHVFRIIQEALSNALHHSKATNILVGLYLDHGMITAKITDDGIGFNVNAMKSFKGMGLKILTYRANLIEGSLRIESSKEGTTITCRLPVMEI